MCERCDERAPKDPFPLLWGKGFQEPNGNLISPNTPYRIAITTPLAQTPSLAYKRPAIP